MARVKLLRQQLEDYQKKVSGENAAYQDRYGAYKGQLDQYNAAGQEYNNWVQQVTQGYGAGFFENNGGWQYMTGTGEGLKPAAIGGRAGPPTFARFNSLDEAKAAGIGAGGYYIVNNGDGTATPYSVSNTRDGLTHVALNQSWAAPARVGEVTQKEPAAPAGPAELKPPNLTQGDWDEMKNPSQDAAGVQMAMNRGQVAKSELADNEKSKNSAFADPEDPNSLKDIGILARVMGGQL